MKKRILSMLLTIVMIVTMLPGISLTAMADSDEPTGVYKQMLEASSAANGYGLPEKIANGRILQAWNWSFANVENNLQKIAEQGFGAVLVSPPNELTEATADGTAADWQKFYAPAGFQINESADNALGDKTAFQSMCAAAEEYGIQIIVDTVVGYVGAKDGGDSGNPMDHVHDRVKKFESELSFHSPWTECTYKMYYGDGWSTFDIEESLTQHSIGGKPDLATENQLVQDTIYDYLKELVDAGADGFCFPDVIHIETDHDLYFCSDFWEDTLVKLRTQYPEKELYAYGSIVGSTAGDGRELYEYADLMELPDVASFWKIVGAVANNGAAEDALPAMSEYTDVLLNESHRNYAEGGTSYLTIQQRNKVWALSAARAGVTGIYLARPDDRTGANAAAVENILTGIELGEANLTSWTNHEVAVVNAFANYFANEEEATYTDGNVAVIERGAFGVVLVNLNGAGKNVSITVEGLSDGTYIDEVSHSEFKVENGQLTGSIGSTGVSVLYCTMAVVASVTIDGDTTNYTDFDKALTAAQEATGENVTLTLLDDIEGDYEITSGTFNIDLNGYEWTSSNDSVPTLYIQGGKITIDDTSAEQTGTINSPERIAILVQIGELTINGGTFSSNKYCVTVNKNGTCSINGGTFSGDIGVSVGNNGTCSINGGTFRSDSNCVAVNMTGTCSINDGTFRTFSSDSNCVSVGQTGICSINGGTFSGKLGIDFHGGTCTIEGGSISGDVYGVYVNQYAIGKLTIKGGTVEGGQYGVYADGNNCTIEGGSISGDVYGVYVGAYHNDDVNTIGEVTITGGTVKGGQESVYVDGGICSITSGMFNTDPSDYVADGYVAELNSDAMYEVVKTYTVKIPEVEGGKVETDNETPKMGDEVTITVTPDEGKEVDEVIVKDENGDEIEVTDNGDGTYTYEQPAGDVTIEVTVKDSEYNVEIEQPEGGKIETDNETPKMGDEVTITVTPDEGKEVDEVIVKDENGDEIEVTDNGDGTYTYEQPAGDVTITVIFNDNQKISLLPVIRPANSPAVSGDGNGDISVFPRNPGKGDTVTITPVPDKGYEVDDLVVTDKNGRPVAVIDNGNGTYSFKQPYGKVSIEVTFREITAVDEVITICTGDDTCPLYGFSDLDSSAWYHDGVHFCMENGLMNGVGADMFQPDASTSRAMIVTTLWRLAGMPVVNYLMQFDDVADGQWYTEAIRWAASEGIVNGYSAEEFGPDDTITREQLAVILYRYEQKKGGGFQGLWMMRMDYADLADVSDWAYEAMCWMNMNGIVSGKPGKILAPKGLATRAEAATMLYRYCEVSGRED